MIFLMLAAVPPVARESSVISSALRSGPAAKLILIVLFGFSIASWAIMVAKFIHFRAAQRQSERFLKKLKSEVEPAFLARLCRRFSRSHIGRIVMEGYLSVLPAGSRRKSLPAEQLREHLDVAISNQVLRFEEMLVFLAIGGSAAPLLGLLGTVWGVMEAFLGMETYHSAAISAVAPGISDALITTIAGLAAAIPAVVGYNYFVNRIKVMTVEMENFSASFVRSVSGKTK